MKRLLPFPILALLAFLALGAAGQKFTEQTERATFVGLHATWTEGQAAPDTLTAQFRLLTRSVNDADATETTEARVREIAMNALRTDRNVTLAGTTLTYRQWALGFLKVLGDEADRPGAPNVSAAAGNAQVVLTWTTPKGSAKRPPATSYTVRRATVAGGPYTNLSTSVVVTNYTDATAANGITYFYEVFGVNAGGAGDESRVSATPAVPVP